MLGEQAPNISPAHRIRYTVFERHRAGGILPAIKDQYLIEDFARLEDAQHLLLAIRRGLVDLHPTRLEIVEPVARRALHQQEFATLDGAFSSHLLHMNQFGVREHAELWNRAQRLELDCHRSFLLLSCQAALTRVVLLPIMRLFPFSIPRSAPGLQTLMRDSRRCARPCDFCHSMRGRSRVQLKTELPF